MHDAYNTVSHVMCITHACCEHSIPHLVPSTHSLYNSGLSSIRQCHHRASWGTSVNMNNGDSAIRVVDGLHYGPWKVGGLRCRHARLLTKNVQQVLSSMVFIAILHNSAQRFCPWNLFRKQQAFWDSFLEYSFVHHFLFIKTEGNG